MGAQNRPQEAPRGDKKQHRNKEKETIRTKDHQERQKKLQKALTPFEPATGNECQSVPGAVWSAGPPWEPPYSRDYSISKITTSNRISILVKEQ